MTRRPACGLPRAEREAHRLALAERMKLKKRVYNARYRAKKKAQ